MTAKDTRLFIRFMPQTKPSNLENKINAALTNSASELWFPQLTDNLTQIEWRRLYEKTKITSSNYATTRVILADADVSRDIAYTLMIPNQNGERENEILVEILPKNIAEQYKKSGVNFYSALEVSEKDSVKNEVLECVKDAFNIIRRVPSLFTTVLKLIKSIHLIKPESEEYDISFSEPHIPFSIFVSIPQTNSPINALRVAEAIVHEAMHLQLTLIENITPLVICSDEKYYSPWKLEYRTVGGVLHALYVFRVIECFLQSINTSKIFADNKNYFDDREITISQQIKEIRNFRASTSLTRTGKSFISRLIKPN